MTKKSLLFGGLIGGAMSLVFLIMFYGVGKRMDYGTSEIFGFTTMILATAAVFFGIRNYRNRDLGGQIGFGRALGTGTLISLVAALAFGIFTACLYAFTDYSTQLVASYTDHIQNSGRSEAEVAQALAELEAQSAMFNNPWVGALTMIFTVFPIGFVMSLISAAILRTPGSKQG
ncbi:MAG: hypothetical protein OHK0039_04080 [Bacteroidia bacterium]